MEVDIVISIIVILLCGVLLEIHIRKNISKIDIIRYIATLLLSGVTIAVTFCSI